jgi:hypothetical protein
MTRIATLVCFAILGALATRRGNPTALGAAFSAGIGLIAAWAFLVALGFVVHGTNPPIRSRLGRVGVNEAVGRSYVMMVPFTVLALLADFVLGWDATQAFVSAGVMTAGAALAADLMRQGARKFAGFALPMLGAFGFSMVWMALSSTLREAMK